LGAAALSTVLLYLQNGAAAPHSKTQSAKYALAMTAIPATAGECDSGLLLLA